MPHRIIEFKEAVGKTIEKITATNQTDFCAVNVQFSDHTALHFELLTKVQIRSALHDWNTGHKQRCQGIPLIRQAEP